MPDRIIRESICTSDTIDKLSWFEEVLWHRLTVNCDDYGRFDGRAEILKGRLFPLKADLALKDIKNAIKKLSAVGLVAPYVYGGKPYLQLVTWCKYQRVRAAKSKYPDPPLASADNCCQLTSNVPVSVSVSESEYMHEAEPASCPPVAEMILNDKTMYPVQQVQVDKWAALYPAVDIMSEVRKMVGWCDSNPRKRKTRAGIERFITSWLAKEQDKGGNQKQPAGWREL